MSAHLVRVSIVIATKDRYQTLFDCVRGLLVNYAGADTEIIVRDNSAEPRCADFHAAFGACPNVVYIADPERISQSENYERGVATARGTYVTMIGDDDGIAWGLLELAAWMDRNSIDAIFPGYSVYLWPGVSRRFATANNSGSLSYGAAADIRFVNAAQERAAVLSSGCTSLEELPRLYYGLVRKRCLDEVRQRAGRFFPGPSPDMANAYSLSYHVARFVVASLPLFIAGNSTASAAGLGMRGLHVGEIASLSFLPTDTVQSWNFDIPFFWAGQTIWCQSAYAAASAMGTAEEFDSRNCFYRLYARLLVFQPRFACRTIRAFQHRHVRLGARAMLIGALAVMGFAAHMLVARVAGFVMRRIGATEANGMTEVEGLPTVSAAMREVDRIMHRTDFVRLLDLAVATSKAE